MTDAPRRDYETLTVGHEEGVDWVTLNRPDRLKAVNQKMAAELLDYFGSLYFNHAVRVVILRGAGRHFCAGFDLNEADSLSGSIPAGVRRRGPG